MASPVDRRIRPRRAAAGAGGDQDRRPRRWGRGAHAALTLAVVLCAGFALTGPSPAAPDPAPPPSAAEAPPVADPGATPPGPRMTAPEFRLGNPRAKVTLVEYASDTCPHCAKFASDVFPEFRKKFVDTGKVLYIFREYPTEPVQVAAAGFVLARCAGETHYFDVITALFQAQATSATVLDFLLAGARAAGMNEAQMKACLNVKEAFDDLNARVRAADDTGKIHGTPTFLVNGVKLSDGEKTLKELEDAVTPVLDNPTRKGARGGRKV